MSTRKRTVRRPQVEALGGRLAPGGVAGGVLGDRISRSSSEVIARVQVAHIGEEIPQVHMAPLGGHGGEV